MKRTVYKKMSVLQEWLEPLSLKKQTVVLGALRAPDTLTSLAFKAITVWIRRNVLKNADIGTGFMHSMFQSLPFYEQVDREFERLSLHTAHHIMLALQVIGIEHPDAGIKETAWKFYTDVVREQHLNPETKDQYETRYLDGRVTEYS